MNPALFVCALLLILICVSLWHIAGHFQRHSRRLTKLESELNSAPESLAQAHEYIASQRQDIVRLYKEIRDNKQEIFTIACRLQSQKRRSTRAKKRRSP